MSWKWKPNWGGVMGAIGGSLIGDWIAALQGKPFMTPYALASAAVILVVFGLPPRLVQYLWALPYALLGFAGAGLFRLLGWVKVGAWRAPALELVCKGPLADWLYRRGWAGFTLGLTVFFWLPPDPELRAHERRHAEQALWLGPLYPLVYLGLLAIFRYQRHPMERDARRAAGDDS